MTRLLLAAALALTLSTAPSAQNLPDWAAPGAVPAASGSDGGGFAGFIPCPPGQVDDGMGGCIPDPPTQVPIDGGLGLLALAGAGLAARRLRAR